MRLVRSEWPSAGGIHRVGMRRNVGYHLENGKPAWIEAMNEVVIAAMIEKRDAVDNIDAILDVEGLDMVQFGGGDYSVRAGLPWRYRDVDAAMVYLKVGPQKGRLAPSRAGQYGPDQALSGPGRVRFQHQPGCRHSLPLSHCPGGVLQRARPALGRCQTWQSHRRRRKGPL